MIIAKKKMTFERRVYQMAKKIPLGKVTTYGRIARLAGRPKAARVVGRLMKNNPYAPMVPCHRVVGWNGKLVGFSGGKGIKTKKKLLLQEGVIFKNKKVDLARSGWQLSL
ncbi:MAG: MGMT family protein [Candidatus Pacebacteria bacterium]|nr:MGMT family protein [Candidatus Paceibacterota bacterium]